MPNYSVPSALVVTSDNRVQGHSTGIGNAPLTELGAIQQGIREASEQLSVDLDNQKMTEVIDALRYDNSAQIRDQKWRDAESGIGETLSRTSLNNQNANAVRMKNTEERWALRDRQAEANIGNTQASTRGIHVAADDTEATRSGRIAHRAASTSGIIASTKTENALRGSRERISNAKATLDEFLSSPESLRNRRIRDDITTREAVENDNFANEQVEVDREGFFGGARDAIFGKETKSRRNLAQLDRFETSRSNNATTRAQNETTRGLQPSALAAGQARNNQAAAVAPSAAAAAIAQNEQSVALSPSATAAGIEANRANEALQKFRQEEYERGKSPGILDPITSIPGKIGDFFTGKDLPSIAQQKRAVGLNNSILGNRNNNLGYQQNLRQERQRLANGSPESIKFNALSQQTAIAEASQKIDFMDAKIQNLRNEGDFEQLSGALNAAKQIHQMLIDFQHQKSSIAASGSNGEDLQRNLDHQLDADHTLNAHYLKETLTSLLKQADSITANNAKRIMDTNLAESNQKSLVQGKHRNHMSVAQNIGTSIKALLSR